MFPDMIKVSQMSGVITGSGYIVGKIKDISNDTSLYKVNEWAGKFEGLNTLFDYIEEDMPKALRDKASIKRKEAGFNFFDTFEQARKVYRNTPKDILSFKQKDDLLGGGSESGLDLEYDVTGDMLDIGRYLSGEPEVFGSLTNGNPRGKRVNILVAVSWSAGVDQKVINERSAQIVRLVDWLESQKVRTQVIGVQSNGCMHLEVIIKRFDEPLNITDIAVVGHSDFLRRIMFRITEYSETYNSGYGNPRTLGMHFDNNYRKFESDYNDEYTVLIDGGENRYSDAIVQAFQLLELNLGQALSDDSDTKVFNIL